MDFELRALPYPAQHEEAIYFIFCEDKLLIEELDNAYKVMDSKIVSTEHFQFSDLLYLGRLDGIPCFAAVLTSEFSAGEKLRLVALRQLFGHIDDAFFWLAARAYHLVNWSKNNIYCGRCGTQMGFKGQEHSKQCSCCGLSIYPKISPAVIVAVTKGDKLLLAKNAHSKTGFYSVLAGFVEPGENLEDCVQREILEEAGITVKNIQYFGSQPWPFPDSLMVGFTAEYAGGQLVLDKEELVDAAWFTADELPEIPGKISISRRLIDWFVLQSMASQSST